MDAVSLNVGSLATQIAYIDTMHTTIGSFSADWEIKGVPLLGELDRIGTDGGSVGLHFEKLHTCMPLSGPYKPRRF